MSDPKNKENASAGPKIIAIDIREAGAEKTGKGWYTYNILKELFKLDKKNYYILYDDDEKQPFSGFKNVQIKVIKAKKWQWHFKVLKDMAQEKVNVFFAPTSYIVPAFAPKKLKVIITIHDLVAFLFPSTHNAKAVLIERLTLKKALKKAAAVCVVSENTQKDLLKKFNYPKRKIFKTPCAPAEFFKKPVPPEELDKFKQKLKLPEKFLLAVGTLEPRKNFSTLIKSFVIIKRNYPDYKLVIVGKKGWKYHLIEETLKQYKMENEVIFTGYLDENDLHKTYLLAKIFVFPSLYEGFGIPPLEAMASGCPVVSSNVASLPEVVGDAGLLIDPQNAYKFADAVISLLESDEVRQMFIERGKARSNEFSWEKSAQKLLEVMERV